MTKVSESQELQVVEKATPAVIYQNDSLEALKEKAQLLIDSKMIPASFNTPEKVIVAIQFGKVLGIDELTALNNIHVLQGKPTISSPLQRALVRKAGYAYKTIKDCEWVFANGTNRPSESGEKPIDRETVIRFYTIFKGNLIEDDVKFTWKQAEKMGLTTKDNWIKMPSQMLYARCFAMGVNRNFPETQMGMYTTAEIVDSIDSKEITYTILQDGTEVIEAA